MEEDPNVKLQEIVREGNKIANLTCDPTLIDSDAQTVSITTSLCTVCGTAEYFCWTETFTLSTLQSLAFPSTMSFQAVSMQTVSKDCS